MIIINFDIVAGTAKLSATTTIVQGADVPVQVVFSAAPGTTGAIAVALGTDAAPPVILAYTNAFESENPTTWNALLDSSDSRLATFMTGKGPSAVNMQVSAVIDGVQLIAPNVSITVQPPIVTGDPTSDGGPTYFTQAQTTAAIAAAVAGLAPAANQADLTPSAAGTAALFAATLFSSIFNRIIPGAGSGAYTAVYQLPDATQVTGALSFVEIDFPASANPTVTLSDGGGTALITRTNPTPAAINTWSGIFRFGGVAWHCISGGFIS